MREYRRRKMEDGRHSVQVESFRLPEVVDPSPLLAVLQECIAASHYKGGSFIKLVQFLRQNDYKTMHIHVLKEQSCFFMLMALGRWIVEIFTTAKQEDLPSHTVILSEFYRFVAKTFRARVHSERMSTAYAYFLNNMALVSLRFKQYTKALQYFDEIVQIYDAQKIQECIFSIAHANLAVLYKQLKDQERSEMYIKQATSITVEILEQCIQDNESLPVLQETGNLLATQCALMTKILKPTDPKYKQPFTRIIELLERAYIKPSHRKYWNIRNLAGKLERCQPLKLQFQNIFNINLEQLRFYSEVGRSETTETHIKAPGLILPPINGIITSPSNDKIVSENNDDISQDTSKYSDMTRGRKQITTSRHIVKQTSSFHDYSVEIASSRYHEEMKEQYAFIEGQNKDLKSAIETLIQKQTQTQKVLEKFILPRIVQAVSSSQAYTFGSSLGTIKNEQTGVVFKNLRANIQFKHEGIIITSFSGGQQKLQWSALKHVMNNFQFQQIFATQFEMNSSQHEVAKMLFYYIDVDRSIKIWQYPTPIYTIKVSPEVTLDFYHVRDELFKVAYMVDERPEFIFYCEMCNKSFDRYFRTHKMDEFAEDIRQRLLGVSSKKREFYMEVIKYKEDSELSTHLTSLMVSMDNILAPLRHKLKNKEIEGEGIFIKLLLQLDQFENSKLFGSLYLITADDLTQKLSIKLHSLNNNDLEPTVLSRQHNYWQILQDYGVNYQTLGQCERQIIKNFICDMFHLRTENIKTNTAKNKSIIYLDVNTVEIFGFSQTFIDQKYFRPARVAIVGAAKKKHGIRFGLYNQCTNAEESFLVTFQENGRPKNLANAKKEFEAKMAKMMKILKKFDVKDIFQRIKKRRADQRDQIIPIEKFMEMYMWA